MNLDDKRIVPRPPCRTLEGMTHRKPVLVHGRHNLLRVRDDLNALGKRMGYLVALRILAILRYEASNTSPSSGHGWVVVHNRSRYGYVGTIVHDIV